MATTPVIPDWLDQTPVDYQPEKELVAEVEKMAQQKGWTVSDGESLPFELRQRTDVLFEQPALKRHVRLSILPKSRKGISMIRLDASNLRTVELVYVPKTKRWRVEAGGVFIEDDLLKHDWTWLIERLFK